LAKKIEDFLWLPSLLVARKGAMSNTPLYVFVCILPWLACVNKFNGSITLASSSFLLPPILGFACHVFGCLYGYINVPNQCFGTFMLENL